jgi:hypothetical protein
MRVSMSKAYVVQSMLMMRLHSISLARLLALRNDAMAHTIPILYPCFIINHLPIYPINNKQTTLSLILTNNQLADAANTISRLY